MGGGPGRLTRTTAARVIRGNLPMEVQVSAARIPKEQVGELADCFVNYARGLFGYACVLTRGDRALAEELVQSAFVAAAGQWAAVAEMMGISKGAVKTHTARGMPSLRAV